MAILEQFANDRYRLLQYLSENQVSLAGHFYVPLSQQDIADGIGFSKAKTNGLMKELKELDCIRSYRGKNGKYQITEKGNAVLNAINGNPVSEEIK